MNKKEEPSAYAVCSQCKERAVKEVRRTRVFEDIVIENIPATYCLNCGEELYDLATLQQIERIIANPQAYVTMIERPVARVA